ncbi:uncharacterized protein LOC112347779 [Selaginella moellendorffii]|uniref:uncharacterized protein LOC112347779 n=1 Tax=Selaginella moellendorffii TaxID=88036 RepID=UPI000D1CD5B9|nr:uncharacterized protein LOC112347779 [Selaginella moellendorffii]|eukprot:XP_024534923.1 uncharacterized protein LOC112347779 [Selaginella moellendorffii]
MGETTHPPTMVLVEHHAGHHHLHEAARASSRFLVSASTCVKIAVVSFGIGVIVGFNLNKRVRKFASRMLKRLKEP